MSKCIEYQVKVYEDRTEWRLNGLLHREDGPAVECVDGGMFWYLNGLLHRDNGPALEFANGYKLWYLNGKRHRADGPAIERTDGSKQWFLNGKQYSEAEYLKATQPATCEGKVVEIEGKKYKLVSM